MKRFLTCCVVWVLLAACGTAPQDAASPSTAVEPRTLRVMTYSSFDIGEETIAQFEAEHDVTLQFLDAGDTGRMISQAILSKDNPQADVLYGVDNTFLSRALEADIFEPYASAHLDVVPEGYVLDTQHRVTPVDYGDVCLNYDRSYFTEHDLAIPQSLADLTDPAYAGLLVVQNPASSSPGLAFLLTTISVFGEEGYLDYWRQLRDNDVFVADSWDTAYYGEFSAGTRPLVVSYATSPAAEVYFSETALTSPPTGAVVAPGTCFRQIEFVGILRNGQNRDVAEAFVDYVLSTTFQEDIPLHMWVFPVSEEAALPEVFAAHAETATSPASMAPSLIEAHREAWIEAWTDVVLR
jgi:thiamine transport system substrate-binding protein